MQPWRVSTRSRSRFHHERSLLHVRASTWLLILFNVGMLIYVRGLPRGASLTEPASGRFAVASAVWVLVDLMIGVAWLSGWPRRCPACDFPNSGEARYAECRNCGHDWAATLRCNACSVFNLPSAEACKACGTAFEVPPRRSLLRAWSRRSR